MSTLQGAIRLRSPQEHHDIDSRSYSCQKFCFDQIPESANEVTLLLYGNKKYNIRINQKILLATIKFLKDSARIDGALF